jgi:serine/threonine protein kinase
MFAGFRPFKKTRQFLNSGGKLSESDIKKLREKQIPNQTIEVIDALIQADRHKRLKDTDQLLQVFSGDKTEIKRADTTPLNAYLKPGDTYDMYEIIEFVGKGKEAQIYKAKNGRSEIVALKLFNREIERERIFREGDSTAAVKSAYVVGCNNIIGHWKDDRYFLILDYIDGVSMRTWTEQKKFPDVETFQCIAMCLLQGVQAFHNHINETGECEPILHNDLKPDNIMITEDNKAVIIDCGIAGPPRVDVFQGTLAYIPPDSLRGADMQFSEDGDLYALGITLWEWRCGQRPYDEFTLEEHPTIKTDCLDKLPKNIRECLIKAIAPTREERFRKIEDMIKAFTGIEEET